MKATTKETVQVTLVLSEKEAEWLHSLMQNPLFGECPENEDTFTKEMRYTFFKATQLKGN